jgi:propanediol utilization protein
VIAHEAAKVKGEGVGPEVHVGVAKQHVEACHNTLEGLHLLLQPLTGTAILRQPTEFEATLKQNLHWDILTESVNMTR